MNESLASAQTAPEGYELVRELGKGLFGQALLCRKPSGESVVVRVPGVTGAPAPRLEADLRASAAAADHACAVPFRRVWTAPTVGVCFEQSYCEMGSLSPAPSAPLETTAVAVGGVRLCTALAHAHRLGILHGDIRPSNVMLDARQNWLLADGGVAHAARRARPELCVEPDPTFAPRELQGWESPAEAADVYSLGATLSALLLGSTDSAGFVPALANEASGLGAVLIRMLAPNPADRPSLVEVDEILRSQVPADGRATLPSAPAGPRSLPGPPRPKVRIAVTELDAIVRSGRRRTVVAATAIATVFLAGASAVAVVNSDDDAPAEAIAALATVEPTPTATIEPTPTAGPSATPRPVRGNPQGVYIKIELFDGRYVLVPHWRMDLVNRQVRGWTLAPEDPKTGLPLRTQFRALLPGDLGSNRVIAGRYLLRIPLRSCFRVSTEVGSLTYSSTMRACPDPKVARAAEAANTKFKEQQKKPTPRPAKKPAREI